MSRASKECNGGKAPPLHAHKQANLFQKRNFWRLPHANSARFQIFACLRVSSVTLDIYKRAESRREYGGEESAETVGRVSFCIFKKKKHPARRSHVVTQRLR